MSDQLAPIIISALVTTLGLLTKALIDQVRGKKNGSGGMSVEFWRAEVEAAAARAVAPFTPILNKQTDILGELRTIAQHENDRGIKSDLRLENIESSLEKVRSNQHDLRDTLNVAIGQRK